MAISRSRFVGASVAAAGYGVDAGSVNVCLGTLLGVVQDYVRTVYFLTASPSRRAYDKIGTSYLFLHLPLKIYLIILKHIKSLMLLKKLTFISNFNVFILLFVCFLF